MTRDHDLIEEMIAIRAVGGLDRADLVVLEREMASHGPDCQECRRLETVYGEVAGRLGFALDPVAVRSGLEQETIERALGPSPSTRPSARRVRAGLRPLIGIAAALVLFAGGLVVGSIVSDEQEVPAEATVVAFRTEEPGTITAAFTPGQRGIYLLGSGLPALPERQVYELWLIEGQAPVPATCVRPAEDGSLFEFVDADVGTSDLMAVTVEPATCSERPTSTPIYTAELAAAS